MWIRVPPAPPICSSGGIGIHIGFKFRCQKWIRGSMPLLSTTMFSLLISFYKSKSDFYLGVYQSVDGRIWDAEAAGAEPVTQTTSRYDSKLLHYSQRRLQMNNINYMIYAFVLRIKRKMCGWQTYLPPDR